MTIIPEGFEDQFPVTYDTEATITLTLGQCLSLNCALYDATDRLTQQGYKSTAEDVRRLRQFIYAQVEMNLELAAHHNEASIAARNTAA